MSMTSVTGDGRWERVGGRGRREVIGVSIKSEIRSVTDTDGITLQQANKESARGVIFSDSAIDRKSE